MIFQYPSIDPIIFSYGYVEIRWYSMAYVLAFIAGSYLIKIFNRNIAPNIQNKLIDNFFLWSIVGVILGGRIGYILFYQFENFFFNPLYILYIWKGGMSFHGGLAGMIIVIFLFSKKYKINFYLLADLVSLVAPIGLFFGRIANFINLELIGRITNFPIAVKYPQLDNLPRHPSQLYEAFFEGLVIFVILLIIFFIKYYKKDNNYGYISAIFLILYSLFRFTIEFLREPDSNIGLFLNLFSMGQLLCFPMTVFAILILKKIKNEQ